MAPKTISYIVLVFLVAIGCFFILKGYLDIKYKKAYIASNYQQVVVYDEQFDEIITLPRGTEIRYLNRIVNYQNKQFYQIKYNFDNYYIETKNITTSKQKIVLEEILYLRSTSTLYNDEKEIITLINKGEAVEVIGFKNLSTDGSVLMYKVKYQNYVGYLYSKYLVNDLDIALSYNEDNLDYYPMEKPNFTNNTMPNEIRAIYLDDFSNFKKLKEKNINSLIIDIDEINLNSKLDDFYLIGRIKVDGIDNIKNWNKIIKKLKKAIAFYGFNEINFADFGKNNDSQMIQNFLIYASEELHQMNTYVSVTVDPKITSEENKQYWKAISNVVDVITPKAFIELFDHDNTEETYKLLNSWASNEVKLIQAQIPTPAKVRCWLKYSGEEELKNQMEGLYNAGLKDGYMIWNDERR